MAKNKKTIWQSTSLWVVSSVAFVMFLIVLALSQNPSLLKTRAIPPTTSPAMGACYTYAARACTQKTKEDCKKIPGCPIWNRGMDCVSSDEGAINVNKVSEKTCDVRPTGSPPLETGVIFDEFKTTKVQCRNDLWTEAQKTCSRWFRPRNKLKAKAITAEEYVTYMIPSIAPKQCGVHCCMMYECVTLYTQILASITPSPPTTSTPTPSIVSTITPSPPAV